MSSFDVGKAEVETLLSLCGDSGDPAGLERDNTVRRASVVLLVSHFESFLREVGEEFIDLLSSGQPEARKIPAGIRELHTLPLLKEILDSNDTTQRHSLLKKLGDVSNFWKGEAKPNAGILNAETLGREVTSAKAEKIDRLFTLMGSRMAVCDGDIDFPVQGNEVVSLNIRRGLSDVVQCRNDVAHGDTSRKPTPEDIVRYLGFLTALVSRLQRKADELSAPFLP